MTREEFWALPEWPDPLPLGDRMLKIEGAVCLIYDHAGEPWHEHRENGISYRRRGSDIV